MGQQNSHTSHLLFTKQLHNNYVVECDLPESSCRILLHRQTSELFMMKQLTLNSDQQLNLMTQRLHNRQTLRHDHYLKLQNYFVKSESSFCSTFHKINALYEYGRHSLRNEVEARVQQGKTFVQKELWSILCSCCIVMAYLERNSVEYRMISPEDIFLTDEGVVKVIDPELSNASKCINARPYYAPELLTSHRQSPNASVFSLGMSMLQLMFLQPLYDCYDYDEFGFNDSLFNVRVVQMEKMNDYSDNLKQVLLKMIRSSDRQRPGILQLEELLFQVVDSNFGDTLVTEDQQSNKLIKTMVNMAEGQSTFRNCELDLKASSQELQSLIPEADEECEPIPEKVLVDLQTPDEAEDKNQEAVLTDRSNVLATSNSNRGFKKPLQTTFVDNQPTFNEDQLLSVIKFTSNRSSQKAIQSDFDKEPTFGRRTATQYLRVNDENLFTDPKLLQLVKRDLQDINMRKSMCSISSRDHCLQPIFLDYNSKINRMPEIEHTQVGIRGSQIHNKALMQNQNQFGARYSLPVNCDDNQGFVVESFNKGRYEGQKKNGVRHGYGTFYYKQGGKYAGEWKDNRMDGRGTLYYYNQRVAYEGQWKQDRLWGYGILYNEQPKRLSQSFDYTCWDQLNEFWLRYEGDFVDDNKCGNGKYYLTNGDRFEGQFSNDSLNGQGVFYTKDGRSCHGLWKNNLMIKQL